MTKKFKHKQNPFQVVRYDNLVEVWLGEPHHPESEFVLEIDKLWLPSLIQLLQTVK